MKNSLLLPHHFKWIGLILLPTLLLILMAIPSSYESTYENMMWHRALSKTFNVFFLVAVSFIALAKEKVEDEYIASLRGQTFMLVVYTCLSIYIFSYCGYCGILLSGNTEKTCKYLWFYQDTITRFFNSISWAVFAYVIVFNFRLWRMRCREACVEEIENN